MAVAEEVGASGAKFLESVIVGYETTSRIGSATNVHPDVHSHGTWGTIGAAAATARLLDFGPDQGDDKHRLLYEPRQHLDTLPRRRNLYPGRSGMQGIMAAQVALCGFTGIEDGPADIFGSILGVSFDPEAVVEGLVASGPLRIQQNYFKLHACCLYNHPVLDGVQNLLRREEFIAQDVEWITIEAPPLATIMTNPEPENMLAAKFSLPYAVAAAVVHRKTDITAFYPERVKDSKTRSLARGVKVVTNPEMNLRRYDYPAARVVVSLRDGRTLSESMVSHHGDYQTPASTQELIDKFTFLAQDILSEERSKQVIEAVYSLDTLKDIRGFTVLLRAD